MLHFSLFTYLQNPEKTRLMHNTVVMVPYRPTPNSHPVRALCCHHQGAAVEALNKITHIWLVAVINMIPIHRIPKWSDPIHWAPTNWPGVSMSVTNTVSIATQMLTHTHTHILSWNKNLTAAKNYEIKFTFIIRKSFHKIHLHLVKDMRFKANKPNKSIMQFPSCVESINVLKNVRVCAIIHTHTRWARGASKRMSVYITVWCKFSTQVNFLS